jgi:hypothetical protein
MVTFTLLHYYCFHLHILFFLFKYKALVARDNCHYQDHSCWTTGREYRDYTGRGSVTNGGGGVCLYLGRKFLCIYIASYNGRMKTLICHNSVTIATNYRAL